MLARKMEYLYGDSTYAILLFIGIAIGLGIAFAFEKEHIHA